ncbi:DEAD/DEAH box helicase family protein [Leptolyngbya sp. PCC 6406]|uniref:DEAD/DEAH box helicase family protein n=1 Tax=Leptolyngbya sp. PCC 6406 TaxID=1173264 RepID=UPI0002ABE3E6|nr:DEAD/DEAH box helicase family protein [Leptolyngbya sp. PCC 6406]
MMARIPRLTFDRGTLILHPPPGGKAWVEFATWDDRVEKFRVPACQYRALVETLQRDGVSFTDDAKGFTPLALTPQLQRTPYPHQAEALRAWKVAGRRGVVVLPTAAGKTYLAQMAVAATPRSTLITVPTLDLMHQWYDQLLQAFPGTAVGLLGGGSRDGLGSDSGNCTAILVATYDSAAIHAETLGNRYGLLICDECHHLPSSFNRVIAEYAIAPYRLGLTATPDRSDGRHGDLDTLIGPIVYEQQPEDLAGTALAPYDIVPIKVPLSDLERVRYDRLIQQRNTFLQGANIWLGSVEGWQRFVQASAQSQAGRRAMLAHREAKTIALGTEGKLRILTDLLAQHHPERVLIFTNDNQTVYRISQDFLIPAITHQTPVKERQVVLERFRSGVYPTLVVSHVLNEGVDVPDARVAILLSGTGSTREYIQRLGRILRKGSGSKRAILYEVIAEETSEEATSRRRRTPSPRRGTGQLELLPYGTGDRSTPLAAESSPPWPEPESPEKD